MEGQFLHAAAVRCTQPSRREESSPRRRQGPGRYHRHRHGGAYHDLPQDPEPKPAHSDYLQRWLNETAASLPPPAFAKRSPSSLSSTPPQRSPSPWHPHNVADVSLHVDQMCHAGNSARQRRRKNSPSSVCSSILGQQQEGTRRSPLAPSRPRGRLRRDLKRPYDEDSSSEHSYRNPSPPVFEKRRRHKTREERYEPRKTGRIAERPKHGTELHKSKKDKPDRKRKYLKKLVSSKDVMDNFTSDTIHRDRVTLPPSLGPGLFKNGKTSRISHLSDLAFKDMNLMQNTSKIPKRPTSSTLRQARKREADEKDMEEMSEYFRSARAAKEHRSTQLPKADIRPPTSTHESNLSAMIRTNGKGHPPSIQQLASNGLCSTSCHTTSNAQSQREVDASPQPPRPSSKGTTYLTWSPSNKSPRPLARIPAATQATGRSLKDEQPSPSSAAVRKALEKTGILSGTHPCHCGSDRRQSDKGSTLKNDFLAYQADSIGIAGTSNRHNAIHQYQDRSVMTTQQLDAVRTQDSNSLWDNGGNLTDKEGHPWTGRSGGASRVRFAFPNTYSSTGAGAVPASGKPADYTVPDGTQTTRTTSNLKGETGTMIIGQALQQEQALATPTDRASHISGFGFVLPKPLGANMQIQTHGSAFPRDCRPEPARNATPALAAPCFDFRQIPNIGEYRSRTADSATLGRSDSARQTSTATAAPEPGFPQEFQKPTHSTEDMSTYIQRIEREVFGQLGPEEPRNPHWEQRNRIVNPHGIASAASYRSPIEQCCPQDGLQPTAEAAWDLSSKQCSDMSENLCGGNAPLVDRGTTAMAPPVDYDDALEMSKFWRPNRFAWY